jgi:hypothetical protein
MYKFKVSIFLKTKNLNYPNLIIKFSKRNLTFFNIKKVTNSFLFYFLILFDFLIIKKLKLIKLKINYKKKIENKLF